MNQAQRTKTFIETFMVWEALGLHFCPLKSPIERAEHARIWALQFEREALRDSCIAEASEEVVRSRENWPSWSEFRQILTQVAHKQFMQGYWLPVFEASGGVVLKRFDKGFPLAKAIAACSETFTEAGEPVPEELVSARALPGPESAR